MKKMVFAGRDGIPAKVDLDKLQTVPAVEFTCTDGIKPEQLPGMYVYKLKSPMALNIPPNVTVCVVLGVACNYPLHIFDDSGVNQKRLGLPVQQRRTFDIDKNIILYIANESNEMQLIERGDTLAKCAVLGMVTA